MNLYRVELTNLAAPLGVDDRIYREVVGHVASLAGVEAMKEHPGYLVTEVKLIED